jgi:predicted nucleic acid-binding Zn ribbon protein
VAKASAPRGFLEHCETLRAITAGRSARTTPVVSRLQTLRAEEAHRPARAQGPYPIRQVLSVSSKKTTGFAPPRLAWRM